MSIDLFSQWRSSHEDRKDTLFCFVWEEAWEHSGGREGDISAYCLFLGVFQSDAQGSRLSPHTTREDDHPVSWFPSWMPIIQLCFPFINWLNHLVWGSCQHESNWLPQVPVVSIPDSGPWKRIIKCSSWTHIPEPAPHMLWSTSVWPTVLCGPSVLGSWVSMIKLCIFCKRPRDLPRGPVVKNPTCNAGDAGSIPGQGTQIPHAIELLSLHTTARQSMCHNKRCHMT